MKKLNIFLKTALIVVLTAAIALLSSGAPTFSWFTRPGSQSGGSVQYAVPSSDAMIAYDGHGTGANGVTMTTFISTNDGISFSDEGDNPSPVDFSVDANRSKTLGTTSPSNRVYYKTVLTNTSAEDQNVSMYIKNFVTGASGEVCVGVNVPIKTFKNYSHYGAVKPSPSKVVSAGTTYKRIYFYHHGRNSEYGGNNTGWTSGYYYAVCGASNTDIDANKGNAGEYVEFHYVSGSAGGTEACYYADLPSYAEKMYIVVKDWEGINYKRTQTFTNLTGDGLSSSQSLLFELSGNFSGYQNAQCNVQTTTGANIMEYYGSAQVPVGDSINLALENYQHTGNISYSITSGASYVSLNTSTGVVSATAAGTAKLTYTVTNSHGDSRTAECTITTKDYAGSNNTIPNAPIVTNLLIPGTSKCTEEEPDKNKQEVYWFIQNGDDMYTPVSNNATVSFDAVYLGV